jgi:hypothetical protein
MDEIETGKYIYFAREYYNASNPNDKRLFIEPAFVLEVHEDHIRVDSLFGKLNVQKSDIIALSDENGIDKLEQINSKIKLRIINHKHPALIEDKKIGEASKGVEDIIEYF